MKTPGEKIFMIVLGRNQSHFSPGTSAKASEYADLMGLGRTQAVADLNSLVEMGIIKKLIGGRSTTY